MKKFLIVVDIQNDFVDGALGTDEAISIVDHAAEKILSYSEGIFVTFDTHFDDYMNTSEGKMLPIPHCIKGTHGWNLNPKIEAALNGRQFAVVEKKTFGSVELPKLIEAASDGEAFEIELIGLCTDICVVSNALILKAHFPESRIIVDASCCAGVTVASHNAALETMKMCQIEIIHV